MKKQTLFYVLISLILAIAGYFLIPEKKDDAKNIPVATETKPAEPQVGFTVGGEAPRPAQPVKPAPKPTDVVLDVPYISETPEGIFSGPWKNACEEASIAMVEKYYLGEKTVSILEAKSFMEALFNIEDRIWGSNANSDTYRIAYLVNNYSSFRATIKDNPTLQDIKNELDQNHPVITPNYGFGLKNPNIPFAPSGSSYHTEVIIGYNDATREFIVNDSGDSRNGAGDRYDYDLFMNTIKDYDYATNKVIGPMRAVFTYPK